MLKKERILVVALCVASSLIGGMVVTLVLQSGREAVAQSQDIVKAGSFQLVDEDGGVHALLTLNKSNEPLLVMVDEEERVRLVLGVSDGNPTISLTAPNETAVIGLAALDDGACSINLSDSSGEVQGAFTVTTDGDAVLQCTKLIEKE